ncbi:uncharacterized protein MYCGRDRAFT_94271 [Zymoseptoria tritici IPO323]|uniref:Uncharacterized protein n=1 Tax=Zymoseptoria tritici (strain CBS 115943 / IPO323) TaxID=336722 RepID=F9XEP3_ZYMTI|nr:uncharacterized protein MYCGRDRAFT_94271 [Zymoseptoria tritici IPO323]EGP86253.1 hypothetical protein MYCGRDRAFT_94271 [Zymoseptoria tritici IPO323]
MDSRVVAQATFTTVGRTFYAAQEMFNRTLEIINAAVDIESILKSAHHRAQFATIVAESRTRKKITLPDNPIGQSINHLATHSQGDLDQLSFRKEDIHPDAEFVATPPPKTVKRKADSTDTTSAAKRPRIVATLPDSTPAPDTTSKRSRAKKEKAPAYD